MKKRVAIIGTQGGPAQYGGFETLVEKLENIDAYILCLYADAAAYARMSSAAKTSSEQYSMKSQVEKIEKSLQYYK